MRTSQRGRPTDTAGSEHTERQEGKRRPRNVQLPVPSLRVVRHVATTQDAVYVGAGFGMVEELGMFVDAAARINRAAGYGYSVGSMALTTGESV